MAKPLVPLVLRLWSNQKGLLLPPESQILGTNSWHKKNHMISVLAKFKRELNRNLPFLGMFPRSPMSKDYWVRMALAAMHLKIFLSFWKYLFILQCLQTLELEWLSDHSNSIAHWRQHVFSVRILYLYLNSSQNAAHMLYEVPTVLLASPRRSLQFSTPTDYRIQRITQCNTITLQPSWQWKFVIYS